MIGYVSLIFFQKKSVNPQSLRCCCADRNDSSTLCYGDYCERGQCCAIAAGVSSRSQQKTEGCWGYTHDFETWLYFFSRQEEVVTRTKASIAGVLGVQDKERTEVPQETQNWRTGWSCDILFPSSTSVLLRRCPGGVDKVRLRSRRLRGRVLRIYPHSG